MKFLLSSNPEGLRQALSAYQYTVTVEAEYGDVVVEGSVLTLAHHGARSGNPAPCLRQGPIQDVEVVGLSHLDLDALGGCLAIVGMKPGPESFWKLAAFVDISGPHKLAQAGASREDLDSLYAFWAWSEAHRVYPPRDGSVVDITDDILTALSALRSIFSGEEGMLEAGGEFRRAEQKLNGESFRAYANGVILRQHEQFVNHLYRTPDGKIARAVVAFNPELKSVTISLADPIPGVSCKDAVRSLWGPLAGGHAGIAGSPRGQEMTLRDTEEAALVLAKALPSET